MIENIPIDRFLEKWAHSAPQRPFLIGDRVLTFGEVENEVCARAERLRGPRGEPVILAARNGTGWVLDALAALRAESPLILIPPGWTERERIAVSAMVGVRRPFEDDEAAAAVKGATERNHWMRCGAAVAFATSGTTGTPRLALRSVASITAEAYRYRELFLPADGDVIGCPIPLCHAYAFGAALAAALVCGLPVVIDDFSSPRALMNRLVSSRTSILLLVAPIARALAELDRAVPVTTALRVAMVGAGPVTERLASCFAAKFGVALSQNYGSSETGATLVACGADASRGTGFPLLGVECDIPASSGAAGQLWVRISTPPLGYVTDGGFEPAHLAPGGWWPTGDLAARSDDGLYSIRGRLDHRIRRSGHTIDPREVEQALTAHPSILEAVVGIAPGSEELEAHVVLAPEEALTVADVVGHLQERIAGYKIPTRIEIRDRLERTWSAKPIIVANGPTPRREFMKRSAFLSALLGYRASEAILAADDIGVFDALADGKKDAAELAAACGSDPVLFPLFLRVLTSCGVLVSAAGAYALAERFDRERRRMIDWERALRGGWLRAESIVATLRGAPGARPFLRTATSERLTRLYRAVMSTREMQTLITVACLSAAAGENDRILAVSTAGPLQCRVLGRDLVVDVIAFDVWRSRSESEIAAMWLEVEPQPGRYQLVLLVNCIHWLPAKVADEVLARLVAALPAGGSLAIVDAFLSDDVAPSSNSPVELLLLDWLTHGGIRHLRRAEVIDRVSRATGSTPRRYATQGLMEIILGSRGKPTRTKKEGRHGRDQDQAQGPPGSVAPVETHA